MAPITGTCPASVVSQRIWTLVDENNSGSTYTYTNSEEITSDLLLPPEPLKITVSGGESSINVSWDTPTTRASDLESFQLFCARASGAASDE